MHFSYVASGQQNLALTFQLTFSTLPPSPFAWLAAGVGEGKLGAVETLPLGEWLMRRLPLAPDLTDFSSVAMEKVLDEQPLLFRSPRCQRPASLVPMTARVGWHLADQIGGSWFCHLPLPLLDLLRRP